ncbi:hypothetical protein ACLOJK_013180 [Asimina triloba]
MMALVRFSFSRVFSKIYTILLILVSIALYEAILKIRSAWRWARMSKILRCLVDKSTAHHLASVVEYFPAAPQLELDDGSLSLESKSKSGACAICLSRFKAGGGEGEVARELYCKHVFHQDCIRRWVEINDGATCPLCRTTLLPGLGGVSLHRWQSEEDCILQEKLCSWFLSWNRGNELHRLVWAR